MLVMTTHSQKQILTLLQQINRAISAQDIYLELRHRNQNLGLATVYRALKALKLKGMVQSRHLMSGEFLYSLTEVEPHYLTCLGCRQSIPLDDCPICEKRATFPQGPNGKIYYHTLEFFGLCPLCQHQFQTEA